MKNFQFSEHVVKDMDTFGTILTFIVCPMTTLGGGSCYYVCLGKNKRKHREVKKLAQVEAGKGQNRTRAWAVWSRGCTLHHSASGFRKGNWKQVYLSSVFYLDECYSY